MKLLTHDQRSDAWRQARVGRLTSSRVADMLATVKAGESAGRRNLRIQLVLERLTGAPQEPGYFTQDMQRGADTEPQALRAYEARTGFLVRPAGFCAHDTLLAGCSPDGWVGAEDGLVEIKCPKAATHLEYLRTRTVPGEYLKQIGHQLWITGAPWCDFVSYDPRFPPHLRLLITRVVRDEAALAAYELLVCAFLEEVAREVAEVEELAWTDAA